VTAEAFAGLRVENMACGCGHADCDAFSDPGPDVLVRLHGHQGAAGSDGDHGRVAEQLGRVGGRLDLAVAVEARVLGAEA
jgi:hypothetical protein